MKLHVIWSETRYLKRCFQSISNEYFLAIWSQIHYLKVIYQSKAKFSFWSDFIAIWSRFFRNEGILAIWSEFYSDMKRYPLYKANVSTWSKFILWYEAIFVRFEANSTIWSEFLVIWSKLFTRFEAKSAIWNDFFLALQRISIAIWSYYLLQYEANFYCDMKRNPLSEANFFIWRYFFERYQKNHAISSKICNLKQIFRSEVNLYCDMK